jgi:hypothetical protein
MKITELDTTETRVRCETCGTNGKVLQVYAGGILGALDQALRVGKDHERQLPYHIVRITKPKEAPNVE